MHQINAICHGKGTIYALDVPVIDKAYEFYKTVFPDIDRKKVKNKLKKQMVNSIFTDGSYWIDISRTVELLRELDMVVSVRVIEGLSNYRSSIVVECDKR